MSVLVFVEGLNGEIKKSSLEAATYGSQVAQQLGTTATAVAIGDVNEDALARLGEQGIEKVLYDGNYFQVSGKRHISKRFTREHPARNDKTVSLCFRQCCHVSGQ